MLALQGLDLDHVRQQAGLHHALLPHVHVHNDLHLLGLRTPGGPSLLPVMESVAKVCRHNLHVLHAEPLLCVADHDVGEPGLVRPPGHVPGGAAPGAAHDQVDSGRAAACWQAWRWRASLLHPLEEHSMLYCNSQTC